MGARSRGLPSPFLLHTPSCMLTWCVCAVYCRWSSRCLRLTGLRSHAFSSLAMLPEGATAMGQMAAMGGEITVLGLRVTACCRGMLRVEEKTTWGSLPDICGYPCPATAR
jgi:hypothetical protein